MYCLCNTAYVSRTSHSLTHPLSLSHTHAHTHTHAITGADRTTSEAAAAVTSLRSPCGYIHIYAYIYI